MNCVVRITSAVGLVALSLAARAAPGIHQEHNAKALEECKKQNQQQRRTDDALLDKYPGEDDLQQARDLTNEEGFYARPHRMPVDLQARRQDLQDLEGRQIRVIENAAYEIQRINDAFDADLRRYREVVGGTNRMPCHAHDSE